jgi:hypothetical protein
MTQVAMLIKTQVLFYFIFLLSASMHQVAMLIKTQVLFYFYFFIERQYAPSGHAHQDAGFVLF